MSPSRHTGPSLFSVDYLLELKKGHPILDSIADGVLTVDRQGIITSFNRAAEQITGFSREQAIGRRCSEVLQASICKESCTLQRTIESGKRLVNIPVKIWNRQGQQVPISINTAVLYDRKGRHIGGVETFRDLTLIDELRKQIDNQRPVTDIVGRHAKMREILEVLPEVAQSDATVLIQGPSGSGKDLLAQAIHSHSQRSKRPLVKVNCAALPETLLESELFGYVKGAFTGAKRNKPGRIALAKGGTLFLDEIGDISPLVQVKLLRVVQEREYEPLGATATSVADVRIIAATNRNLAAMMAQGSFHEDLYHCLNIVELTLPSLAERQEDIPRLVHVFLRRLNAKMDRQVTTVSDEAMRLLMDHGYPGNVRELENAIEHALVLSRGNVIEARHLPAAIREGTTGRGEYSDHSLESAEVRVIQSTLEAHGGNRTAAALALGLHRTTLWRKMRRHSIT